MQEFSFDPSRNSPAPSGDELQDADPRRLSADDEPTSAPLQSHGRPGDEQAVATRPPPFSVLRVMTLMLTITTLATISAWLIPITVERIEYARERGRQKAQVDVAAVALNNNQLPLKELSKAYQLVSQRVGPSVVHINTLDSEAGTEAVRQALQFRRNDGQGSGVVIDANGYVLTNRHVVHAQRAIEVVLSDGRHFPATVVGEDLLTDLALLRIDATSLIAADWGDSEDLEVGALVWAVGSPFGLERSITFGILSAKHRSGHAGTPFQDLMQTDAAVNPGNSGGPLVDATGKVVGINTAIIGPSYQGISFAVPSNVARDVFERLKTNGRVQRGWLGVELEPLTLDQAKKLGLPDANGAFVRRLADERLGGQSPAKAAGIQAGDVIVRWNELPITSPSVLIGHVGKTSVGEKSTATIIRDGSELQLEVVVGERPEQVN